MNERDYIDFDTMDIKWDKAITDGLFTPDRQFTDLGKQVMPDLWDKHRMEIAGELLDLQDAGLLQSTFNGTEWTFELTDEGKRLLD